MAFETRIGGTGDLSEAATRTIDQASSNINKAIDKASDAARPAVKHMAAGAHHAVDRFAGSANRAVKSLDTQGRRLKDAQLRFADSFYSHVRERPITSLGIAVAGGVLLGWLLRQR